MEVERVFGLLFAAYMDPAFTKNRLLSKKTERPMLPLVRAALLGYFHKRVVPEVSVRWTQKDKRGKSVRRSGRIDFRVGGMAIEFAMRGSTAAGSNLSAAANTPEIRKLMKWKNGRSILVLFDYSKTPYSDASLNKYRNNPGLGSGTHRKPFTLLYYHLAGEKMRNTTHVKKVIRRG